MKILLLILFFISTAIAAETFVTVEGRARNWGNIAIDDAKNEAQQLAISKCNGEAEQSGEWEIQILNHKEGMLYVSATSQFKCL